MIRAIAIVSCALLLGACSTSYKVAPTTAKLATKLATAKRSTQESRKRTVELEADTKRTQVEATTTAGHIDAALAAVGRQDYVTAAQELIAAKASNGLVMMMLEQSLRNVTSLKDSLATTEKDLTDAIGENAELQKKIDKLAESQAKNQAIVDQVNWGFGLGAFIYGIKRILTFGFFGILGLIVIVVVMLCIGGPAALWTMRGLRGLWGLWKNRKTS